MAELRRFTFETEFDGVTLPSTSVYKRLYTAEEAQVLAATARAEGEAAAMERVEAQAAKALTDIAVSARAALPALAAAAHEHRVGAAELALAAARQIADAACDRFPEAPLQAALAALAREVEACPKLVLRTSPDLLERLQAALKETADAIGYSGQIIAKANPACRPPPSCSTGATAAPPSIPPPPQPGSPKRWKAHWPPKACTRRR